MIKNKKINYILIMLACVASFFMLSNTKISAEITKYKQITNEYEIYYGLEESETDKYTIAGVYCDTSKTTCTSEFLNGKTISNLIIPNKTDDDYDIISIKDSNSTDLGVLRNLISVATNEVTISGGIKELGKYSFAGFSIKKITLSDTVELIDDYAFSNASIEEIIINRYDSVPNYTALNNANVFNNFNTTTLKRIVLKGSSMCDLYKTELPVWSTLTDIKSKMTFKIVYRFDKDNGTDSERFEFYNGEVLSDFPTYAYSNTSNDKTGFKLTKWISQYNNTEVSETSTAFTDTESGSTESGTNLPLNVIISKWELKDAEITIKNYKIEDNSELSGTSLEYNGKDKGIKIKVTATHDLMNEAGFSIEYIWKVKKEGSSLITNVENTTNEQIINFTNESGNYRCNVVITYGTYTVEKEVTIDSRIAKRAITIKFNDNTTTYGEYVKAGKVSDKYYTISSGSLAENEEIDESSVTVSEYTNSGNKIDVGTYNNVLEGEISKIVNNDTNYIHNYDITYVKGNLQVNKKNVTILLTNNYTYHYGDTENLSLTKKVFVYGSEETLNVTLQREDSSNKNVGSYEITNLNCENTNYNLQLNTDGFKVIINKKEVSIDWNYLDSYTYNGSEYSVSASYKDNSNTSNELKVKILDSNEDETLFKNAGTYKLVAEFKNNETNYKLKTSDIEKTVTIEKAIASVSYKESATLTYIGQIAVQIVTYNGENQLVSIELNNDEGTITQTGTCKNASASSLNKCEILVNVAETANYKAIVNAKMYLHINQYEMNVSAPLFELKYSESNVIDNVSLSKEYTGLKNEKITVYFKKSAYSPNELSVGDYDIGGVECTNSNYKINLVEGSGIGKIKIVPAQVEVDYFYYSGLVYDGKVKNIEYRTSIDGNLISKDLIGASLSLNGKTEVKKAGTYTASVSLTNNNYEIVDGDESITFEVNKATYDISSLKLTSKNEKFNFSAHYIELEGTLPTGLSANYTIDDKEGNGTLLPFKHTIKVYFSGDFENYNEIKPITAELYIDFSWVIISLALIITLLGGGFVTIRYLYKKEIIRVYKPMNPITFKKVKRINKRILAITKAFEENVETNVEEIQPVEEEVKFVKTKVQYDTHYSIVPMSFIDELFKSQYATKHVYSELKNELLSYEGIVSKIKRDYETFYVNGVPIAKIDVVDGILQAYFALDPSLYNTEEYHHEDASKEKDFVTVPLKLTVNTYESLRQAKMFVRIIRKREQLKSKSDYVHTDYATVYTAKEKPFKMFKKDAAKKDEIIE